MIRRILRADYTFPAHAEAVVLLLDTYARDIAGGGESLSEYTKTNLVRALASRSQVYSILAFDGDTPVGLVNCIEGFSTFACKPLVNVHDVFVLASYRGRGLALQMLVLAEEIAQQRGAVKMTLEVLMGNQPARSLYERLGFVGYQLDPSMGMATFMHKLLPIASSATRCG